MRKSKRTSFCPVALSLQDLLGGEYAGAVSAARAVLCGEDPRTLQAVATERVAFFPASFQSRLLELLRHVGETCTGGLTRTARGATTDAFQAHTKTHLAPISGCGYFRITEEGRLHLTTKSEHYHASLGHAFPGYQLLENARRLGIPNATHNNTRGHITRCLEEELVRAAAGIQRSDSAALEQVLASKESSDLNRVINLATGSVAVEAAIKMVLSRFFKPQADSPDPEYAGRIPVLIVIGGEAGGLQANYHGTTVIAQTLRGMWPEVARGLEDRGLLLTKSVSPENVAEFERLLGKYNEGRYKVAAFVHELILMNYGAKPLSESFVQRAYALCKAGNVPTIVDEIQTGIWSPDVFLFREYGIHPDVVVVGKGFAGGEFAASRVLFSAPLDRLPQFGALVTNGQEELASLAYLVAIRWLEANAEVVRQVGEYYQEQLHDLAARHATLIDTVQGGRHLAGICFHELEVGRVFAEELTRLGIDISVQTYKTGCPPIALTKLPLVAGFEVVDLLINRMSRVLEHC